MWKQNVGTKVRRSKPLMGQCLDYGQLGGVSTILPPEVLARRELSKPLGDPLMTKMLDIRGSDLQRRLSKGKRRAFFLRRAQDEREGRQEGRGCPISQKSCAAHVLVCPKSKRIGSCAAHVLVCPESKRIGSCAAHVLVCPKSKRIGTCAAHVLVCPESKRIGSCAAHVLVCPKSKRIGSCAAHVLVCPKSKQIGSCAAHVLVCPESKSVGRNPLWGNVWIMDSLAEFRQFYKEGVN
jgi:hypothetical protein